MTKKRIFQILEIIFLIMFVVVVFKIYKGKDFNNFTLSEKNMGTSVFKRDNEQKYNDKASYNIESPDYNDAMFYESIQVKKDTPYKVTCMVKTADVESKNKSDGSGAQISVEGTTDRSMAISGTTDWQQIEMIFNSKNKETVNVGFRLGGYVDDCEGKAWFSDFKIEEGKKEENTEWKFACFIFNTLSTTINGENLNYTLSNTDISDIQSTIRRFESAAKTLSGDKMTASCDIYKKDTPINTLTYDEEYGYYVAPETIGNQIKDEIALHDYDHIFIIFKLDDKEVKDWVGLGSMDYYGVGYSNIRLSNKARNYLYKYDSRINRFPEEVFLHEFLHSLERTLKEYDYEIPALHDNEKYGYKNELAEGLKAWYEDYMTSNIKAGDKLIGLDPIVYKLKPAKESNFIESQNLGNAFYEPQNIFQEIAQIFEKAKRNIGNMFKHD